MCQVPAHLREPLLQWQAAVELSGDTESRRKEKSIIILVGKSSDGGELRVPREGARQESFGLSLEGRTGIGQRKTGKWTLVKRNNRGMGL